MKSGLEDRNNSPWGPCSGGWRPCGLNEVRPGRPEQSRDHDWGTREHGGVSMKSGLEGRNNDRHYRHADYRQDVSMKSDLEGRNNECGSDVAARQWWKSQ